MFARRNVACGTMDNVMLLGIQGHDKNLLAKYNVKD